MSEIVSLLELSSQAAKASSHPRKEYDVIGHELVDMWTVTRKDRPCSRAARHPATLVWGLYFRDCFESYVGAISGGFAQGALNGLLQAWPRDDRE